MYSLNVPAPGRLERLAADLHPRLAGFERIRERHSLVLKRFESDDGGYDRLYERVRRTLAGAPAVEARVSAIDCFADPVRGPGPVVYFAVESPGLLALHERFVDAFGAVPSLEGTDYVPHVTLARGGSAEQVRTLRAAEFEPVEWTVSALSLWDPVHRESVATLSLPFGSP